MVLLGAADLNIVEHWVEPLVFLAATERKHGFSSTLHALKRNSRLNPLMPLLCRGARYSPAGGRMVRGLLYLGSARFHFS